MSTPSDEPTTGISDDQLPEDLVPGEDNPLAEGLPDGEQAGDLLALLEQAGDLLEEGKPAEESEDAGQDSGSESDGSQG